MRSPQGPAAAPLTRRLVRGGGWALLARTVALPIGLLQAMLLTRILTPAEVGAYFLAISLIGLLAILAQGGMSRPMVKMVASALATERPRAARHAIRVALLVTLAGGVLLALALAAGLGEGLSAMLEDGDALRRVLPIIAAMVLAFALIDVVAETLRGFHDLRAASAFGDYLAQRAALLLVLGTIWLAGWPADLTTVLAAALAAAVLMLSLALGQLRRQLGKIGRHGARWRTAEVLGHGLPFLLMRLNFWFSAGADLWVLGMFRPPEEVAIYGAASRLAVIVGTPLAVSNAVLAPVIAELHSRGERTRLEKVMRAAATLGVLPSLLLATLFFALGDQILSIAFTEAYAEGRLVVVILAIGHLVNVLFGSCALALTMTGHQRDVVVVSALAGLVTVVAFYLVAPAYGAPGVALAAALALIFYNVVLAGIVRWRLRMITWGTFSPSSLRRFADELTGALIRPR
ncbi:MAG: lipopolysaccharide biosynthesis protein [Kiloniellales bacterium]